MYLDNLLERRCLNGVRMYGNDDVERLTAARAPDESKVVKRGYPILELTLVVAQLSHARLLVARNKRYLRPATHATEHIHLHSVVCGGEYINVA